MKLNFWQWVGLVAVIVGVAAVVYRETRPKVSTPANPGNSSAPVVQPTR